MHCFLARTLNSNIFLIFGASSDQRMLEKKRERMGKSRLKGMESTLADS